MRQFNSEIVLVVILSVVNISLVSSATYCLIQVFAWCILQNLNAQMPSVLFHKYSGYLVCVYLFPLSKATMAGLLSICTVFC